MERFFKTFYFWKMFLSMIFKLEKHPSKSFKAFHDIDICKQYFLSFSLFNLRNVTEVLCPSPSHRRRKINQHRVKTWRNCDVWQISHRQKWWTWTKNICKLHFLWIEIEKNHKCRRPSSRFQYPIRMRCLPMLNESVLLAFINTGRI